MLRPAPAPPVTRELSRGAGFEVVTASDSRPSSHSIAASPERVWTALLEAYSQIGIPTALNPAGRTAGNPRLLIGRRLAREPVATFLNCGAVAGTPKANAYRVELSISTWLEPTGSNGTRIQTLLTGKVSKPSSSSGPVPCMMTGQLENRIATLVQQLSGS